MKSILLWWPEKQYYNMHIQYSPVLKFRRNCAVFTATSHKFGSEWSWWYYRTKDYMKSFKKPDDASDFAVSSTLLASLNFSMFLRSTECQTTTFFSVNSLRIVDPLDQYSERCLHR